MDEWVHKSAKNTFIKVDDLFKIVYKKKMELKLVNSLLHTQLFLRVKLYY